MKEERYLYHQPTRKMILPSWSALTFLLVMTLPQVILSDLQACSIPRNFSVKISEERDANIIGAELWTLIKTENVTYETNLNGEEASITIDKAVVAFRGRMIIEHLEDGILTRPVRISRMYESRATGTAKLLTGVGDINYLQDCRFSLASDNNFSDGIPAVVNTEIRRLTESCLGAHICQIMTTVSPSNNWRPADQDRVSKKQSRMLVQEEASPVRSHQPSSSDYTARFYQKTINTLVDIAIAEIVQRMNRTNGGIIDIPNIDEHFSKGHGIFKIHGHFEANDGTFRDLTTLKRTEDANLTHTGQKFTAKCGVGLSVTKLQYNSYKLKLGIVRVSGKIRADIDGVALEAQISVDYSQKPCTKSLDELRVTHLGNAQIHITGMGPLNHLTSKLLSWVTKKWRTKIIGQIQSKLRDTVIKQLEKFDCEKYRA